MPIYEYQCSACGHQMEALQRMSDAPLTDCPACNGATLRKKISAAGFRLKGGGWYETDFKTGGKKNLAGDAAKPDAAKPKETGAKGGAKADKPAAGAS
ncbi:FmdB family zinc ribbon protein [Microbulbifer sp.]|uniref:FmdB family zinc ribbon protein n=1 Tax=Microbulbifer sp. TaxID=1908541 RepID=UPI003F2E3074